MKNYCVFDIETAKTPKQVQQEMGLSDEKLAWSYPQRMGFAVGVAYDSEIKDYIVFKDPQIMANHLRNFKGTLISFNGVRFDLSVLSAHIEIDHYLQLQRKPHLDLLADFYDRVQGRFRIGLDNMAKNTIGKEKTGSGADAPLLFQTDRWDELIAYCKNDVQITKEIFEFGITNKYIIFWDNQTGNKATIKVDYNLEA